MDLLFTTVISLVPEREEQADPLARPSVRRQTRE